jgi:two-component system, chemotaxis family, sensor kinase CheA
MIIKIKKERIQKLNDFISEYPGFFAGIEDEIIRLESKYQPEKAEYVAKQFDTLKEWYSSLNIDASLTIINRINQIVKDILIRKKEFSAEIVDACLLAINFFNNIFENLKNQTINIDPVTGLTMDLEIEIPGKEIADLETKLNSTTDESVMPSSTNGTIVTFNQEILGQFIFEAADNSTQIENILLQIENNPASQGDSELINTIFRSLHSMKGGSALILSTALSDVPSDNPVQIFMNISHSAEAVLQKIRDNKEALNNEIINKLFSVIDNIKLLLTAISANEKTPADVQKFSSNLKNLFRRDEKTTGNDLKKDIKTEQDQAGDFKARLKAFLNVAEQSLDAIEHCHKTINEQGYNPDSRILDKYFRSLKNLGSSSSYQGYSELTKLIQQSKDILVSVKEGKSVFDKILSDLLFENYDRIKESINEYTKEKKSITEKNVKTKSVISGTNIKEISDQQAVSEAGKDLKLSEISSTLRVKNEKIDKLMNLIGELIVAKNMFSHISKKLLIEYNLPQIGREVKEIGSMISRIADGLQNTIMDVRMVPIKSVFQKFPRMVRDLSKATGKEINLVMLGEETHLDKIIIEKINDPLIHIIRNAVDHGIENIDERKRKGKNPIGTITIKAESRGNIIYVEVSDDGKGIDPESIKLKALEKELISLDEAEKMSAKEAFGLLFIPGFSTAKIVSEISGRGVGLDIVKSNIADINGSIDITSDFGRGTTIGLLLPLTLVISKGLIITINKQDFVLPLESIQETIKIPVNRVHKFKKHYVTEIRNEVISLIPLNDIFGAEDESESAFSLEKISKNSLVKLIILNINGQKAGLVVDDFSNEQEIVIKPLNHDLAKVKGISGATIMGDGKIVLIINPMEIFQLMYKKLLTD